jgi:hypothetical protein
MPNITTVELTNPFATLIAFYETSPKRHVELTVASNCENAEIDVNGQKVSGKGGKFQFNPGDKVQLSVRDFPTINFCGPWQAVHTFEGWYEGGTLKSKAQQYTFTITQDTEISAKYGFYTMQSATLLVRASVGPSNPIDAVPVSVSPLDRNGAGDGKTPFTRVYDIGDRVTLKLSLDKDCSIVVNGVRHAFDIWRVDQDAKDISGGGNCREIIEIEITGSNPIVTAVFETLLQPPGGLPDLTVSLPTVSVSKPDRTGMCDVTGIAVVRNIGQGDAGPFAMGIFVDGKSFPDFDFPSLGLKAGAAESVPFIVMVPTGKHLIEAVADWKNEVNEFNEQNNKAGRIIECKWE